MKKLTLPEYKSDTHPAPDPALTALLHEWDRKLRASGFQDIEHRNANGTINRQYMRDNSLERIDNYRPDREEYYRRCRHWCWDRPGRWRMTYRGTQYRTKRVWLLHTEGASMNEIAKRLHWPVDRVSAAVRSEERAMVLAQGGSITEEITVAPWSADNPELVSIGAVTRVLAEAPPAHWYRAECGGRVAPRYPMSDGPGYGVEDD